MQWCVKVDIGNVGIIPVLWLEEEIQNVQIAIPHTTMQGCVAFLILQLYCWKTFALVTI